MTCDWPVEPCVDGCAGSTRFESMAADFLNRWTGGSFGLCPTTVRPCRRVGLREGMASSAWRKARVRFTYDTWLGSVDMLCGRCGDECSCGCSGDVLRLPGPVHSVEEVLVDGVAVDPSEYRVDDHSLLVRTSGRWPYCQDTSIPATEPGTFQVSYTRGSPVPEGGRVAAGLLACEFGKAARRESSCQLPQRIQSVTRQGMSVTLFDDFSTLTEGATGIFLVDSWVASVMKPPRRASVRSVDLPRRPMRVQTWP